MKTTLFKIFAAVAGMLSAFAAQAVQVLAPLHDRLFAYQVKTGMVMCMDAVPSAYDFNSRRVTNAAQSEVIRQRFYDYMLYPTAGAVQIAFFSQPVGQGVTSAAGAVVGSAKSYHDTNLVLANTLPSGSGYLIESIEVLFTPGSVNTANTYTPANLSLFAAVAAAAVLGQLNDINTIYQSGLLELNILSKNYLRETPLLAFPPKAHLDISAAVASNSATTAEVGVAFGKASGRPYMLDPTISLQAAVNFDVTIKWPQAVATPSGFNGRMGVILDGFTQRASQ